MPTTYCSEGPRVRGIFPLQVEMFTGQFGQSNVDPRWLHYGVFEFAPTETRHSWLTLRLAIRIRGINHPKHSIRKVSPVQAESSLSQQQKQASSCIPISAFGGVLRILVSS